MSKKETQKEASHNSAKKIPLNTLENQWFPADILFYSRCCSQLLLLEIVWLRIRLRCRRLRFRQAFFRIKVSSVSQSASTLSILSVLIAFDKLFFYKLRAIPLAKLISFRYF